MADITSDMIHNIFVTVVLSETLLDRSIDLMRMSEVFITRFPRCFGLLRLLTMALSPALTGFGLLERNQFWPFADVLREIALAVTRKDESDRT